MHHVKYDRYLVDRVIVLVCDQLVEIKRSAFKGCPLGCHCIYLAPVVGIVVVPLLMQVIGTAGLGAEVSAYQANE